MSKALALVLRFGIFATARPIKAQAQFPKPVE